MAQTSVQSKSQELKNTLDSLIDNYRENPEQIAELLAFKSRFYRYSMNNTALILNQNPYATFVASYDDWQEKGYQVQRGQQGIKIIFPIRTEIFEIGEKDGKKQYRRVTNATSEEKKLIANGQIKPFTTTRFGVGNVFDISQTNCPTEEYPKFFHMGYRSEQHSILYDSVKQYAIQKGISVEEVDLQSISLRGEFSPLTNSIRISDKLNDTEKLSTLTHELGHALLHRDPASLDKNSSMKELEADCISIMLQQQFGIELTDSRKKHFAQHYRMCQGLEDFSLEDMLKNVNHAYLELRNELDSAIDAAIEPHTPVNIQSELNNSIVKEHTVIINAFGGPGAGKTTACYDILSELKKRGFAADYAPEYATELVWDNKLALLDGSDENQPKLLAEQKHRIDRLIGKVDFVVTDSPLLLNAIYYKGQNPDYEKMVQETYSEYNNFNFVMQRDENLFTPKGRIHNLEESKVKDKEIFDMLSRNGLSYGTYTHESVGKVVEDAIAMYQSLNVPAVPTQELKKNLDIAEQEQNSKKAHSVDYKEQDTAAVLDYIKRGVSILQVAEDMGFTLQQIGGYYTLKEHDSVRFYMDTNSFHRFSADVGGSTIDFVKHFGGMNDKEAILTLKEKYVGNRLDSLPQYAPELTAAPEPKKFVLPDKIEGKYARVFAYLTKTRCIDADIVQGLMTDGLIYEDKNHNVVFVGKDASGQPAFATRHTTLTQSNYKRDVAGSSQDVGFHIDHSATRIYVTEAPIDALSIMCLRKQQGHDIQDANYLATCGTGKDATLYYWLKSHPQIKEVILANDNDEAGQKASRKIFQTLKKDFPEIKISTLKIQGKDANEHLCIKSCPKNPKKKIQQEVER